jgi:phenylpropionate dioxygenase-like ring-hydroxylating dioxygenase large terminal subunit
LLVKSAFKAFTLDFPSNMMPSPVLYGGQEMFDWNRAWYPIAPLEYLNADAPNAVKLLGKRMVLWCSNQDSWIVDPKLRMGRNE